MNRLFFLSKIAKNVPKHLPRSLGVLFAVIAIVFIVQVAQAITPNPGHPWTEVGDGVVIFSGPTTIARTYTLPDANASILTTTAGGLSGYVTRWTSSSTFATSTFLDNGIVTGINATSAASTFTIRGSGSLNPLTIASSTGATLFQVLANGTASSSALVVSGTSNIAGTATFSGGATISSFTGGSWIDLPTSGPSGIGTGGAGANPFIAYAQGAGQWFTNANAGDIAYRNTTGRLLFGNTATNASMVLSGDRLGLATSTPVALLSLAQGTTAAGGISFGDISLFRSGAQTLTVSGSIIPATDLTYSFGTNINRLINIYSQNMFASSSILTNATTTNLFATNGTITNASTTNLSLSGRFSDSINNFGTNGQLLKSTGTSTLWVATSTLGLTPTEITAITRPYITTGAVTAKAVNSLTVANVGLFSLPFEINVNQVTFTVTTNTTAGTMKFCIYDDQGTRVIDVTSGTTAVGANNIAVANVKLPAGNYYVAHKCATTCNVATSYFTSTAVAGINSGTIPVGKKVYEGTATMTSGQCNATLPAITPAISSTVIGRLDN